ncbi:hypothetical protein OF83DRAFT_487316 [Amylostereum chailletii]|nr:hypothetical protein OF83DRAFT_487316 [Amylostereum chailletii]
MSLFAENPRRNVAYGIGAVLVAHAFMRVIPHTLHAYTLTQTSVAVLAMSSLMVFIVAHHRRSGNVLTIAQEELIIVSALGFFWLAMLVAWRAIRQGGSGGPGEIDLASATRRTSARQTGFAGSNRGWPCSGDDAYCIVEEWSFF